MLRRFLRDLVTASARSASRVASRHSTQAQLTAIIQREGEWYVAWVEEIPGVNTQGATLEEVRENLREAIMLVIESNREDARRAIQGHDVIREHMTVAM